MTVISPRPYSALGYPPASPDHPRERELGEELIFVLDAHRLSKWAPTGLSVRHLGLHMAIHPDRPDRPVSVIVSRPQGSPITWLEIGEHSTLEEGLAWINSVAFSIHGDYAPIWRANPLDVTAEHWERALDAHPNNPRGLAEGDQLLDRRLGDACDRFLALYARYGGWHYYGRPDATDPAGYAGPLFWQEEDVRFRISFELEREFPSAVHLNSLLSPATVPGWDAEQEGKHQYVDVLLDDLRDFVPGQDALRRFAERTPTAFLEIKFIRRRRQARDVQRDLQGVVDDACRLGRHRQLGRAERTLMLVVDDDGRLPAARETMPWPNGVSLIHAAPSENAATSLPEPWSGALASASNATAETEEGRDDVSSM